MDSTSLGALLSGIFGTANAGKSAALGASAASPFQTLFPTYQGQLPGVISNLQSSISGAQGQLGGYASSLTSLGQNLQGQIAGLQPGTTALNPNAGTVPTSVSGSGANLTEQLNSLASNYMQNPAIQAQYKLGLNTVNAQDAAQGLVNSGAQQIGLEQYGQNFASNAYNNVFNQLLQGSNAAYQQNVGATALGAQLSGQTFTQGLEQQQQLLTNLLGQGQLGMGALQGAGGLASSAGSLGVQGNQGLLNTLSLLSGASLSSPATAGSILSGEFGNSATQEMGSSLGLLGSGVGSLVSGLGGLGGIGSALGNLFGGNSGVDLGGLSFLGGSGVGDMFSGGGGVSTIFGSGLSSDLGSSLGDITNNVLSDAGTTLAGFF